MTLLPCIDPRSGSVHTPPPRAARARRVPRPPRRTGSPPHHPVGRGRRQAGAQRCRGRWGSAAGRDGGRGGAESKGRRESRLAERETKPARRPDAARRWVVRGAGGGGAVGRVPSAPWGQKSRPASSNTYRPTSTRRRRRGTHAQRWPAPAAGSPPPLTRAALHRQTASLDGGLLGNPAAQGADAK